MLNIANVNDRLLRMSTEKVGFGHTQDYIHTKGPTRSSGIRNHFGNDSNACDGSETQGSPTINSVNTKDFFALEVENTRSNLESMTTHFEYHPLRI